MKDNTKILTIVMGLLAALCSIGVIVNEHWILGVVLLLVSLLVAASPFIWGKDKSSHGMKESSKMSSLK